MKSSTFVDCSHRQIGADRKPDEQAGHLGKCCFNLIIIALRENPITGMLAMPPPEAAPPTGADGPIALPRPGRASAQVRLASRRYRRR